MKNKSYKLLISIVFFVSLFIISFSETKVVGATDSETRTTTFDNDYYYYNADSCGIGYNMIQIKSTKGDNTIKGCVTTKETDDVTALYSMKCPQGYPRKQGGGFGPVWVCAAAKNGENDPIIPNNFNSFSSKVSSSVYNLFVNSKSCINSVELWIRIVDASNSNGRDVLGCMYDAAPDASSLVTCPDNSKVSVLSITNKDGDTFNAAMCLNENNDITGSNDGTTPSGDTDNEDLQLGNGGGNVIVPIDMPKPGLDYNNLCNNSGFKQAAQLAGYIIKVSKWLVPLLIIIFGMIDFTKAVISNDEQAVNKATGALLKRIVAGFAVFFTPSLIFAILNNIEATKMENTGLTIQETNTFVTCTRCLQYPSDCIIDSDLNSKFGEMYVATLKRDTRIIGNAKIICSIGDDFIDSTNIEVTLKGDTTIQAKACIYKRDRKTDYQVTCSKGSPLKLVVANTETSILYDAYVCEGEKAVDENPNEVG